MDNIWTFTLSAMDIKAEQELTVTIEQDGGCHFQSRCKEGGGWIKDPNSHISLNLLSDIVTKTKKIEEIIHETKR